MIVSEGLEGIVAAQTVLSDVDGEAGRLTIRGFPVETLAASWTYEEAVHLLWDGFFADLPADLQPALGAARVEVFEQVVGPGRASARPAAH